MRIRGCGRRGRRLTPNGAGKSSAIVAGLALWWLAVHPRGRVVITSKDARQLDNQVWAALSIHRGKFPTWTFLDREIRTETGGMAVGFTTNDAGRAEGWHKQDDIAGPLLIICDEAKSIDEEIFQAFDRCTFNGLLYISSGGAMMGRFYDAHTKLRAQFRTRAVSLKECPHIPKEKIDDIIGHYGLEHPFTRSAVFGEFMAEDDSIRFVAPLTMVQSAIQHPPAAKPGARRAFCDFAAGGDENVLAIREGNVVRPLIAWRERNTMAAVGRFIVEFRKAGLLAEEIFADEGGLGKTMCDAMMEAGWTVHRVNNGAAPFDDRYINRGGEMWHATARQLLKGEVALPADDALIAQLTTRRARFDSKGRLGIETKDDLAKRSLPSPDRADAVCGVCAAADFFPVRQSKSIITSWREELERREENESYSLAGMDAGE